MLVQVDVYSKDVDKSLEAFKNAFTNGARVIRLHTSEDDNTGALEYINLMFEAEHTSEAISFLDSGAFQKDRDKL